MKNWIPEFIAKGPRTRRVFSPATYMHCNMQLPNTKFIILQKTTVIAHQWFFWLYLFKNKRGKKKYRTKMSNVIWNNRFTKRLEGKRELGGLIIIIRMNCFSKHVSQENADQWGRWLFNLPLLEGANRSQSLLGSRSHSEKALFGCSWHGPFWKDRSFLRLPFWPG